MISVVSAYVPIPGHPRSEAEYDLLGDKLLKVEGHILFAKGELERCWLYQHLFNEYKPETYSCSASDNPAKNTLSYHIVIAQKTEWLEVASYLDPQADVFVWIDYGIFHIPGVTAEIIADFLRRVENEKAIVIPGCWEKDAYIYNDKHPCWRFCGGLMVVPREHIKTFNAAVKGEYIRWLKETGNISWEANTLARLERQKPDLPLWWYHA